MATFLLIHGKWHDSTCWQALSERLRSASNRVVAPDLPFEDPSTTYAERIEPALTVLGDVPDPVIVAHSLGTGYAPLIADARPASSLVYLCPAPVGPFDDVGAPMRSTRAGFSFPRNRPDGTSVWEPDVALSAIYPRLAPETAQMVAACLKPGSSPVDVYPLDKQPDVPTRFVYAQHDEFFEPEWSRWVAREIAGVEPIELDTGHFPMVEDPDAVAELLLS